MTYLKDGIEYLDDREYRICLAVRDLTRWGRAANNSQVASTAGVSRTTTASLTAGLRRRGYLQDVSKRETAAYRWRLTGKTLAREADNCPRCGTDQWDFDEPGQARCEFGHTWPGQPAIPGTLVRSGYPGDVNDPERFPDDE